MPVESIEPLTELFRHRFLADDFSILPTGIDLSVAAETGMSGRDFENGRRMFSAAFPERFGPKRKSGARKLRGVEAGTLRCLRDLQATP